MGHLDLLFKVTEVNIENLLFDGFRSISWTQWARITILVPRMHLMKTSDEFVYGSPWPTFQGHRGQHRKLPETACKHDNLRTQWARITKLVPRMHLMKISDEFVYGSPWPTFQGHRGKHRKLPETACERDNLRMQWARITMLVPPNENLERVRIWVTLTYFARSQRSTYKIALSTLWTR